MIKLYNSSRVLVAILQNAFNISYEQRLNELHTASFSLPADDPKVTDCLPYSYVEIFDGAERIDLFRIMPTKQNKDSGSHVINFQCEHVLSTLLDDLMFQLQVVGSITDHTNDVIDYILAFQTVTNWVLDVCSFTETYEYKWENENLLNAVFAVPKPFNTAYQWTWNTAVYPWKLSLIIPSADVDARILYKRNLVGIEKFEDPTNLITRLYGLGYGEGVNQLTISAINGGLPYIDASTIGTYGTISRIFADTKFENATTLKAMMTAILEENKIPKITYTVKAADIYQITSESLDKFELGNLVQVDDSETGFSFNSRVVSISKSDIVSNPGDIELQISNKVEDINNTISTLQVKASVNELYSQGATNIDSHDFQDNCDATHAALIKFYLSDEVVRLNKCMLNYDVAAFRAYSASVKGGGGQTSSASSEATTAGGGVVTSGASSEATTVSGNENLEIGSMTLGSVFVDYTGLNSKVSVPEEPSDFYLHGHDVYDHSHSVNINGHTHSMAHTHQGGEHTHGMAHTHTVADHTHDIEHGIYEFGYLPPSVVVKVDGNVVTGVVGLTGFDIDIVPYLTKTGTKVNRGVFHTVEVIPGTDANNPKGLARIFANVVKQVYMQSVGGGDY